VNAHRRRDLPDEPGGRPSGGPGPLPGDLFEDIVAGEPGLDALFGLLTSEPTPDELSGANAALAMFRASRPPTANVPGAPAPEPRAPGPRAPGAHASSPHAPGLRASRSRASRWNAKPARRLAAAVTLAAAAGLAVAAYTEALPAPLQHAAYRVLGFAGIPDARHGAASATGAPRPIRGRHAHRAPGSAGAPQPSGPVSALPGASAPATSPSAGQTGLSVTAANGRIKAGGSDTFTGRLSVPGQAVAGVTLGLEERAAGQRGWRPAGSATTDAAGDATVTASDLTRNALFRFAGPHAELSQPVLVIVVPPVSASLVTGPGGRGETVTASSPLASPGDVVVLQAQSGTRWRSVSVQRLDGSEQAAFMVRGPGMAQNYRVMLLATADHGGSVSNTVTVPAP
jgi:hypothetical protein